MAQKKPQKKTKAATTAQQKTEEQLKLDKLIQKLGPENINILCQYQSQLIRQGIEIGGAGQVQDAFENLCLHGVVERYERLPNPAFPGLRRTYWVLTDPGKRLLRYLLYERGGQETEPGG